LNQHKTRKGKEGKERKEGFLPVKNNSRNNLKKKDAEK